MPFSICRIWSARQTISYLAILLPLLTEGILYAIMIVPLSVVWLSVIGGAECQSRIRALIQRFWKPQKRNFLKRDMKRHPQTSSARMQA